MNDPIMPAPGQLAAPIEIVEAVYGPELPSTPASWLRCSPRCARTMFVECNNVLT